MANYRFLNAARFAMVYIMLHCNACKILYSILLSCSVYKNQKINYIVYTF